MSLILGSASHQGGTAEQAVETNMPSRDPLEACPDGRCPFESLPVQKASLVICSVRMTISKPMGRPPGKHSNPAYVQMTIYIDRQVRNLVKSQLALQDDGEFSGLVEVLLRRWLVKRGVVVPEPKLAGRK
jgi:hypothetical protein